MTFVERMGRELEELVGRVRRLGVGLVRAERRLARLERAALALGRLLGAEGHVPDGALADLRDALADLRRGAEEDKS
jgi:hypothetical protein